MKPKHIELAGFTAYRDHTELDLGDADLFVLAGPTGAGKSSIIDAMIFALYGSVPRLEDNRQVGPVISKGKLEARVRFDFALDGRNYSAVRVVRRDGGGRAATKEARLECGDEVLASGAKQVTEAVQELVGLTFDQFTRCVVLPQGAFARFLNDKPTDRQELLVQLLGLGLYRQLGARARAIAATEENNAAIFRQNLEALAEFTPEAEAAAKQRLQAIREVNAEYQARRGDLAAIEERLRELDGETSRLEGLIAALQAIEVPAGMAALAERRLALQADLERAEAAAAETERQRTELREARTRLGDIAPLVELRTRHQQLAERTHRLEDASAALASASEAADQAAARLDEARRAADGASEALAALNTEHLAHALRERLSVGEPCPVCEQVVTALPADTAPEDLERARAAEAEARAELESAEGHFRHHENERGQAAARVADLEREVALLRSELEGKDDAEQVEARIADIEGLEERLRETEAALDQASSAASEQRSALAALAEEEETHWESFDRCRDAVAALTPPARSREGLAASWQALTGWAETQLPKIEVERECRQADAETLRSKRDALLAELASRAAAADVKVTDGEDFAVALARAESEAKARLHQIGERLAEKRTLGERIGAAEGRGRIAKELGNHLAANRFEAWLLDAAFQRLVGAASEVLRELSGGAYSFAHTDAREFEVIDHANADERRSVRTLSGGETFLASLALALSLSDQVADLAAEGAPRIESIFLDEGFGSLDPDTLETVATAIEELGAHGLTVGLVTHVRELAERIPVQFRVTKDASSARVERIAA